MMSNRVFLGSLPGIKRGAGGPLYNFLVNVSGATYTAYDATGAVVSSNTDLATVIDAIKAAGVIIQFGAGTFDYGTGNGTFNTLDGIQFWGSGIDVTVIQNNSSAAADTEPFSFTRCNNVVIKNLTVSANGSARSTSDAIDNDDGDGWLIENVKITASRSRGIVFDGKDPGASADNGTIRNCYITGTQGSTSGDGIELLAAQNNLVEGCTIVDVAAHGVQMTKGSTASGRKASGNTVRNNTITNSGRDGVNILSSDGNTVSGNVITNSANITGSKDGVRIETTDAVNADTNVIDGNTCTDNQTPKTQRYGANVGPALAGQANNNQIINNILTGNNIGAYSDTGTGTVISGNTV